MWKKESRRVAPSIRRLTVMTTALFTSLAAFAATANPASATHTVTNPGSASIAELQQQIIDKQHELEVVNEQYLQAEETLTIQSASADAANAMYAQAEAHLLQAQQSLGIISASAYKGPQLAGLSVLMTSTSPREVLDKLATLDLIAADSNDQIAEYAQAQAATAQTKQAADSAKAAAEKTTADIAAKKTQLESEVPNLEAQLGSLTADQRAAVLTASGGQAVEPAPQSAAPLVAAAAPSPVVSSGSSAAQAAVQAALSRLGSPYSWGATGPNTFDCSGLLLWSYGQAGVGLPRTSSSQKSVGPKVSLSQLLPGDLLWEPGHIAMYIGNGQIVHAPTTGDVVKVVSVGTFKWSSANRPTG